MNKQALAALALISLTLNACGGDDEQAEVPQVGQFPLTVTVVNERGEGVPRAPVILDEKPIGMTDKDGVFKALLTEQPGTAILLEIGQLEGYGFQPGANVKQEVLSIKPTLDNTGLETMPVTFKLEVASTTVEYLLWVHASCDDKPQGCQGLKVMLDGEEIATTDALGRAHLTMTSNPHKEHTLELQTPRLKPEEEGSLGLTPRDPKYTFKVGDKAQAYMIEAKFEVEEAAKPKRAPSRSSSSSSKRRVVKKPTIKKAPAKKSAPKKGRPAEISIF